MLFRQNLIPKVQEAIDLIVDAKTFYQAHYLYRSIDDRIMHGGTKHKMFWDIIQNKYFDVVVPTLKENLLYVYSLMLSVTTANSKDIFDEIQQILLQEPDYQNFIYFFDMFVLLVLEANDRFESNGSDIENLAYDLEEFIMKLCRTLKIYY